MFNHLKVSLIAATILAFLCIAPLHAHAQAASVLKYGDNLDQDLSADFSAQSYTFTGKKGDVAVILVQITPTDSSKAPNLKVSLIDTDPKNPIDYTSLSSSSTLADQLLADGTYTVTVERSQDEPDQNTGKYNIALIQPTALEVGKSVSGKLTADTKSVTNAYYTVKSAKNFSVELIPDSNNAISFYATIDKFESSNAVYSDSSSLESDSWLLSSTLKIPVSDGVYLVKLETSTLYSGSPKNYSYSLSLTPAN